VRAMALVRGRLRWAVFTGAVILIFGCSAIPPVSPTPTDGPSSVATFAVSSSGPGLIPSPSATSGAIPWQAVALDPAFTGATIADLAGDLGRLIAVGTVGDSAAAWSSEDGIVWRRGSVPGDLGAALTHVRIAGPDWTVAGVRRRAGSTDHVAFWTSVDGATWKRTVDSPLLSLRGGATDVFAIHPPGGELLAIGTTCRLPIPAATPCASRLFGFSTAADRTTWRSISLPALPSWAVSISVLRLDMHNGLPVALGVACSDNWENPPCAFFALRATAEGWHLTLGERESAYAGDTLKSVLAAGSDGQYEIIGIGPGAVWLFDPYAQTARFDTLQGRPPDFGIVPGNPWFGLVGGVLDIGVVSSPDGLTWTQLQDGRWTDSKYLPDITGFAVTAPTGSPARAVFVGRVQDPGAPDHWGLWTLDLGNAR